MNLIEGCRRIGLLLGGVGGLFGMALAWKMIENLANEGLGERLPWLLLPVLGFLGPWVAMKALAWIVMGFRKGPSPR